MTQETPKVPEAQQDEALPALLDKGQRLPASGYSTPDPETMVGENQFPPAVRVWQARVLERS